MARARATSKLLAVGQGEALGELIAAIGEAEAFQDLQGGVARLAKPRPAMQRACP